ncbi:hypothetical protein BJ742DRAFT_677118, partial [Cladochytrium replicatum]
EQPRSHRILFLLEKLGIAYEIKHDKRTALGTAPHAPDPGRGSHHRRESGVIIQYLTDYHNSEHKFKPCRRATSSSTTGSTSARAAFPFTLTSSSPSPRPSRTCRLSSRSSTRCLPG